MSVGGAFDLRSAKDLLSKARFDFARLQRNPTDTYAAFDLFVTLRHLPEWIFIGDKAKVGSLFDAYPELRVCRHVADGVKHFVVTAKYHRQVQRTVKSSAAWGQSWGESWGAVWGEEALVIELDSADIGVRSLGTSVSAVELAEKAIAILEGLVP